MKKELKSGPEPIFSISSDKVCFVIVKARAFDAKVEVVEDDPGSNPSDADMREVLEDFPDDPTFEEVKAFIDGLNVDEQIDLVALAWLGRGDYEASEWLAAREQARLVHTPHTADYLLGMPMLGDYLEEGLAKFGLSCEEFELGHL